MHIAKSPWIPNQNRDPRASLILFSNLYLIVGTTVFGSFCGRQGSGCMDGIRDWTEGWSAIPWQCPI